MALLEKNIPASSLFFLRTVSTDLEYSRNLSPKVYQYVEDCRDYPVAIETLQALYVKPTNEIYAHRIFAMRHQQPAETLDKYFQSLKSLSKDCNYQGVTSILKIVTTKGLLLS